MIGFFPALIAVTVDPTPAWVTTASAFCIVAVNSFQLRYSTHLTSDRRWGAVGSLHAGRRRARVSRFEFTDHVKGPLERLLMCAKCHKNHMIAPTYLPRRYR